MRFSIRELLMFAVVCALAMLAWNTNRAARDQVAKTNAVLVDLEKIRGVLFADDPDAYAANMHELDAYAVVAALRDKSEEHFKTIQNKHSAITPRDGVIFSARTIPTLRKDGIREQIAFRIFVPKDRELWLKYGVYPTKRNTNSTRQADKLDDLVTQSPFGHSGPYQLKLKPGTQTIQVDLLNVANGELPFRFMAGGKVLIDSAFRSNDVDGHGKMSLSATKQVDFKERLWLGSLITINMNLKSDSKSKDSWGFAIWISDRTSEFAEFPGQ